MFRATLNNLAEKGKRPSAGHDPQRGLSTSTYTLEELDHICMQLGNSARSNDVRDASMLLYMHHQVARGDSARLVYLSDLCIPILMRCAGDAAAGSADA